MELALESSLIAAEPLSRRNAVARSIGQAVRVVISCQAVESLAECVQIKCDGAGFLQQLRKGCYMDRTMGS